VLVDRFWGEGRNRLRRDREPYGRYAPPVGARAPAVSLRRVRQPRLVALRKQFAAVLVCQLRSVIRAGHHGNSFVVR
jgi:hypothetical protein